MVFAHLCKIWRVYAALSWVSMIRSGFDTHLNVQNRKMYAMVTLCTFLLRLVLWCCQIIEHFYWCLHTFVKYDECMQHFHEWVWLDRDLTLIWMCRIERCTQWLHSVHSCCAFALMLSKYYTFLLCLHTFVKYDECMQHFHEWVWLDRDLTRIWMCRIERCTQWLHSVHTCCAFALMLSKYYTFLLCLHTFVKYDECMQHFHEWVWLDRDLTLIWMCRIERCTQCLHSVHSWWAWCSDVVK